jgi:putative transposase
MRMGRSKASEDAKVAYYHCITRVVDKRFIFEEEQKERFVKLMRAYEEFCGVRIITFCIMSNHAHILCEVPHRPAMANLPSDQDLVRLVEVADCSYGSIELARMLKLLRDSGDHAAAEALREQFFARMWDVSAFMQTLKQRFTQWFNGVNERCGTLWEGRFKSVLVEGASLSLSTIAAYIDLNPVRAGMVTEPEAYRWCGYAQALAGQERARQGLRVAVSARRSGNLSISEVLASYRQKLYEVGIERRAGEDGTGARIGFSRAKVEAVIEAGGKLGHFEALRCKVRYFSDGVVFGSREFVEEFFQNNRSKFGARRQTGARSLRLLNLPGLFTVRDLRSPVTPGSGL